MLTASPKDAIQFTHFSASAYEVSRKEGSRPLVLIKSASWTIWLRLFVILLRVANRSDLDVSMSIASTTFPQKSLIPNLLGSLENGIRCLKCKFSVNFFLDSLLYQITWSRALISTQVIERFLCVNYWDRYGLKFLWNICFLLSQKFPRMLND